MNPEAAGRFGAETTDWASLSAPPSGFGMPPPWPDLPPESPTEPRRRTPRTLMIAVVAMVVLLIAAGVFALRPGEPPVGAPATPVGIPALSGLLLSPAEAGQIIGSEQVSGNPDMTDTIYQAMSDKVVADAACMSLSPGLERSYRGSGFTASRQQFLKGSSAERKIVQTVVSFADPATAEKHVAATHTAWRACANKTVNLAAADAAPDRWAVSDIKLADGIVTTSRLQEGGDGWMCRDGIAARNNIVIDVAICGEQIPESAPIAFVDKVDGKIRGLQ